VSAGDSDRLDDTSTRAVPREVPDDPGTQHAGIAAELTAVSHRQTTVEEVVDAATGQHTDVVVVVEELAAQQVRTG